MKFAKHLAKRLDELSTEEYREHTVPYKTWKKVKEHDTQLDSLVERTCVRIDSVFRKHWRMNQFGPASHEPPLCCSRIRPTPNPRELLEFADLNRTAIYKICKKWRKQGRVSPELYHTLRNHRKFAFMGSGELTLLKIAANSSAREECPICLDIPEKGMVMACGHWMCWSCLDLLTRVDKINGTINNKLLVVSARLICPMCRERDPLRMGARGVFEI